jgi:hypothetical protein
MNRLTNDLRSHPVRVAFHGLGFRNGCKFNHLFGCTKVCKLDISLVINQDVAPLIDVTMPICNPLAPVLAFISNLGPDKKPKMLKVGPKFFQPRLLV